MKTVYLIHGWDGNPENNWFPWLKSKLEGSGFKVVTPAMPDPETPKKSAWVKFLLELVPSPDENTYFVGHSMGCQAIQRYLEVLPEGRVGGVVLVAGWIHLPHWDGRTEEELEVLKDWHDEPKDFVKMKQHCPRFISIFSTDDEFINKINWDDAKKELGSEIITIENKGHFADDDGVKELPEAFEAIMKISQ